jgi:hypothetical protein
MLGLACYGLPWRSVGPGAQGPRRSFGRKVDGRRVRPARRRVSSVVGVRRSPVRGGRHHVAFGLARPPERGRNTRRDPRGRAGCRSNRQRGPPPVETRGAIARARGLGDHRPELHGGGHRAAASTAAVGAATTAASRRGGCRHSRAHLARSAGSDAHHPPARAGAGPAREHRFVRRERAAFEATFVDRARRRRRGPRRGRDLGRIGKRRGSGTAGSSARREDGPGHASRHSAASSGGDPRAGGSPTEDRPDIGARAGAGPRGRPRTSPAARGSSRGGAGGTGPGAGSPSGRSADSEACRASQGRCGDDRARRAVLNELYTSRRCGEDPPRQANQ